MSRADKISQNGLSSGASSAAIGESTWRAPRCEWLCLMATSEARRVKRCRKQAWDCEDTATEECRRSAIDGLEVR
jgi:hypothetical protein